MDKEKYFDTAKISGQYQKAVAKATASALISFCEQEPEFEQAVEQSGKTFQQCLDRTVQGIKTDCSDFEVFSGAVKFYFSTAIVHFHMTIDLCGNTEEPEKDNCLGFSLDELLGGI